MNRNATVMLFLAFLFHMLDKSGFLVGINGWDS